MYCGAVIYTKPESAWRSPGQQPSGNKQQQYLTNLFPAQVRWTASKLDNASNVTNCIDEDAALLWLHLQVHAHHSQQLQSVVQGPKPLRNGIGSLWQSLCQCCDRPGRSSCLASAQQHAGQQQTNAHPVCQQHMANACQDSSAVHSRDVTAECMFGTQQQPHYKTQMPGTRLSNHNDTHNRWRRPPQWKYKPIKRGQKPRKKMPLLNYTVCYRSCVRLKSDGGWSMSEPTASLSITTSSARLQHRSLLCFGPPR